jgi:hypothetical protein
MESRKSLKMLHRTNSYIAENIFNIANKKIAECQDSKSGSNFPKSVVVCFSTFHTYTPSNLLVFSTLSKIYAMELPQTTCEAAIMA